LPKIKPFRGILYDRKNVRDLTLVVAPPYDVISKPRQNELYRNSPYNIVRIELGKIHPSDSAKDNRYTRARSAFGSWLESGILARDSRESFYIYSQQYRYGGKTIERFGFMGLMSLDEKSGRKVLPHENTLLAPKLDRLDLTRMVRANLSPIYVLYDDDSCKMASTIKKAVAKARPFMDIRFERVRNRAWRCDDPRIVHEIGRMMSGKDIFIADGHHRYEVSKMYREELRRRKAPQDAIDAAASLMVYFVASDEKILTVLPAHRLPRDIGGLTGREIVSRLSKHFRISGAGSLRSMMALLKKKRDEHAFGMYLGKGRFYVLILKDVKESDGAIKDKPKEWRRLDVSILHRFIFVHILGIKDSDDNIEFVKSPEETAGLVDKGAFKVAFFLNPTKVSQIKRIARLGEKMPRKATYFYPKPISGVVINPLWK
jgi:uncharacterized protein (DUF1015 family)